MTVWMVSTGPGDPALLTVQVEHLLATAEAVAHEPAVALDILLLTSDDARVVEIEEDDHPTLVAVAVAHESVVRLSTGDRLALQAGGAEAAALRAAGFEVVVVPVVLAAFALPATKGIPVMARDLAPVLTVTVGDAPDGAATEPHARPGTTAVAMADAGAPTIALDGAVASLDLRTPTNEVVGG